MKRTRAYIASILIFILLFSFASQALAATPAELAESRRKAEAARQAAQEAEAAADALRSDIEEIDEKISAHQREILKLRPQINAARQQTSSLETQIAELNEVIAQKEAEITRIQAEHDKQTALLADRITVAYKQGDGFFLEVLLQAETLKDFFARTALVQRVVESDRDLAVALENTRVTLEGHRAEHARSLEAVQARHQEARVVENNLRDLQSRQERALHEQQTVQNQKAAMVAENAENAERLLKLADDEDRESARIAAELRARSSDGSGFHAGEMVWPVPGFNRVSSPFGWRTHPIFKERRMHWGIDIAGRGINGASVVAADEGEVISAGRRGGYGVTVMVDHGNGVATLYAHLLNGSIDVSRGQRVSRGQHIASVGSTGFSTGAHLHFEVRINGRPVDPMPYLR